MIVGSITNPLIILLGFIYSFDLIDFAIGEESSKYHGYIVLAILIYPILLAVYWVTMWLIDRATVRRLRSE